MGLDNILVNLKTAVKRDEENKRYLPYCDYGWHQGIVRDYRSCEERDCKHYKRLYIPNDAQANER